MPPCHSVRPDSTAPRCSRRWPTMKVRSVRNRPERVASDRGQSRPGSSPDTRGRATRMAAMRTRRLRAKASSATAPGPNSWPSILGRTRGQVAGWWWEQCPWRPWRRGCGPGLASLTRGWLLSSKGADLSDVSQDSEKGGRWSSGGALWRPTAQRYRAEGDPGQGCRGKESQESRCSKNPAGIPYPSLFILLSAWYRCGHATSCRLQITFHDALHGRQDDSHRTFACLSSSSSHRRSSSLRFVVGSR